MRNTFDRFAFNCTCLLKYLNGKPPSLCFLFDANGGASVGGLLASRKQYSSPVSYFFFLLRLRASGAVSRGCLAVVTFFPRSYLQMYTYTFSRVTPSVFLWFLSLSLFPRSSSIPTYRRGLACE